MKKYITILIQFVFLISSPLLAKNNSIEDGLKDYKKYCGTCHGQNFQGGMSKSLIDGIWQFDSSDEGIAKIIKSGKLENGMPSFQNVLKDSQINDIIKLIRSKEKKVNKNQDYEIIRTIETFDYKVNVELATNDVEEPWAIDFISPSMALVTEKPGRLRVIKNGLLEKEPVKGTPKVRYAGQGGLLDVAVDPDYVKNGWIYLSYSHDIDGNGMTKIVREKLKIIIGRIKKFYSRQIRNFT